MNHSLYSRVAQVGDVYAIQDLGIRRWFLVQVIQENEKGEVALLGLDYLSSDQPTEAELDSLTPLKMSAAFRRSEYDASFVSSNRVPKRCQFVGTRAPLVDLEVSSWAYGWPRSSLKLAEFLWQSYPESVRVNFKNAMSSMEDISIGPRSEALRSSWIRLDRSDEFSLTELNQLGALSQLDLTGHRHDLLPFLRDHPRLSHLNWTDHEQIELDFQETQLTILNLEIGPLKSLYLNPQMKSLTLSCEQKNFSELKIHHGSRGHCLHLSLFLGDTPLPDLQLPELSSLDIHARTIDLAEVVRFYPRLACLQLWGEPAVAQNFACLSELSALQELQLRDIFGITEDDIPQPEELPLLESLWLTSVPKAPGQLAKKRFRELPECQVSQLRNQKWLAQNLHNPFRHWDGRQDMKATSVTKAVAAYKKIHTALGKSPSQASKATTEFVEVFNKLHSKGQALLTTEREDIADVLVALAREFRIDENQILKVFDTTREF